MFDEFEQEGQVEMASKQSKVPSVVLEAQKVAEHLDKRLMDRIVATPWFFAGSTFQVLASGAVKVVYFHQKSDLDYWYRGTLMWRDDEGVWQADKIGSFKTINQAVKAIDALHESEEEVA